MNNYQQAAVVLKCLPRSTADKFLSRLDPDQCNSILQLMQQTVVTTESLRTAINQLAKEGLGKSEPKHRVDQRHEVGRPQMASVTQPKQASQFAFLKNYDSEMLLEIFNNEHPRDAATILATLPRSASSAILSSLEPEKRMEIIRRLASRTEPTRKELTELNFALRIRIQKLIKSQTAALETEASATEPQNPIERLATMSDQQIKALLKRVDTTHLAPALKACPTAIQKKVLRNMAAKPAAMLAREILEVRIDDKHRILRSSSNIARAITKVQDVQM